MNKFKAIISSIGFLLLPLITQIIIIGIFPLIGFGKEAIPTPNQIRMAVLISWIILLLIFRDRDKKGKIKNPVMFSKIKNRELLFIIISAVGINMFFNGLRGALFINSSEVVVNTAENVKLTFSGSNYIITLLAFGIIGPIGEEYIFRGLIYNKLKQSFTIKLTIIIQAILFVIVHLDISQILVAFVTGIILGYIVFWTNNIIGVMLFHVIFNTMTILLDTLIRNSSNAILMTMIVIGLVMSYCGLRVLRDRARKRYRNDSYDL